MARKPIRTATIPALVLSAFVLPNAALSQDTVLSFSLGGSGNIRGGDDTSEQEPRNFKAISFAGLGSHSLGSDWRLQWDFAAEWNDVDKENDAQNQFGHIALEIGRTFDAAYAGAFLHVASNPFVEEVDEQNAVTTSIGVAGAYHFPDFSVGATLGYATAKADDGETITDVTFVEVSGDYFFNNDMTSIGAALAFAGGSQDFESGAFDTEAVGVAQLTVGIEHMLKQQVFGGATSLYAEMSKVWVEEWSTASGFEVELVDETKVTFGMRILFGADTLKSYARSTAPRRPEIARWQAIVPTVD